MREPGKRERGVDRVFRDDAGETPKKEDVIGRCGVGIFGMETERRKDSGSIEMDFRNGDNNRDSGAVNAENPAASAVADEAAPGVEAGSSP